MPIQIFHLPDEFYFSKLFTNEMISNLVYEIASSSFNLNHLEIDLTSTTQDYFRNVDFQKILSHLDDPKTVINSITLNRIKSSASKINSIVLFLEDMPNGYEATFTFSGSPTAVKATTKKVKNLVNIKYQEIKDVGYPPNLDWGKNQSVLLKECWGIKELAFHLRQSKHVLKQDIHYLISEPVSIKQTDFNWDIFIAVIWQSVDQFFPHGEANAEVIEFPAAQRHHIFNKHDLIRLLVRREVSDRSFILRSTDKKNPNDNYLRIQYTYDYLEDKSLEFNIRIISKSKIAEDCAKIFRFTMENLLLEIHQNGIEDKFLARGALRFFESRNFQKVGNCSGRILKDKLPVSEYVPTIYSALKILYGGWKIFQLTTIENKVYYFNVKNKVLLNVFLERKNIKSISFTLIVNTHSWLQFSLSFIHNTPIRLKGEFKLGNKYVNARGEKQLKVIVKRINQRKISSAQSSSPQQTKIVRRPVNANLLTQSIPLSPEVGKRHIFDLILWLLAEVKGAKDPEISLRKANREIVLVTPSELNDIVNKSPRENEIEAIFFFMPLKRNNFISLNIYLAPPKEINLIGRISKIGFEKYSKEISNLIVNKTNEKSRGKSFQLDGQFIFYKDMPKRHWTIILEDLEHLLPSSLPLKITVKRKDHKTYNLSSLDADRLISLVNAIPIRSITLRKGAAKSGNYFWIEIMFLSRFGFTKRGLNGSYNISNSEKGKVFKIESCILNNLSNHKLKPNHTGTLPFLVTSNTLFHFEGGLNENTLSEKIETIAKGFGQSKIFIINIKNKRIITRTAMHHTNKERLMRLLKRYKGSLEYVTLKSARYHGDDVAVDIQFNFIPGINEGRIKLISRNINNILKMRKELLSLVATGSRKYEDKITSKRRIKSKVRNRGTFIFDGSSSIDKIAKVKKLLLNGLFEKSEKFISHSKIQISVNLMTGIEHININLSELKKHLLANPSSVRFFAQTQDNKMLEIILKYIGKGRRRGIFRVESYDKNFNRKAIDFIRDELEDMLD